MPGIGLSSFYTGSLLILTIILEVWVGHLYSMKEKLSNIPTHTAAK